MIKLTQPEIDLLWQHIKQKMSQFTPEFINQLSSEKEKNKHICLISRLLSRASDAQEIKTQDIKNYCSGTLNYPKAQEYIDQAFQKYHDPKIPTITLYITKFCPDHDTSLTGISDDTIRRLLNTTGTGVAIKTIKEIATMFDCDIKQFPSLNLEPQNPYHKYIDPYSQTILGNKLSCFVGRHFVFEAIDEFLASEEKKGYLKIIGNPGMGKTSIAAYCHQKYPSFIYFNVLSGAVNTTCHFQEDICNNLAKAFNISLDQANYQYNNNLLLGKLLNEISQTKLVPSSQKIIIIVDGLDEAEKSSNFTNILSLPQHLPNNIFFLVTQRPDQSIPLNLDPSNKSTSIDLQSPEYQDSNRKDIKKYIEVQLEDQSKLSKWIEDNHLDPTTFINKLIEKADNNFMYIAFLIREIVGGKYTDTELEELPKGLNGYYNSIWEKKEKEIDTETKDILSTLLNLHQTDPKITDHKIATYCNIDPKKVKQILIRWKSVINCTKNGNQTIYQIYHHSFADYLREQLDRLT